LIKLINREEIATLDRFSLKIQSVRHKPHEGPKVRRTIGGIFPDFKLLPTKTSLKMWLICSTSMKNEEKIRDNTTTIIELEGLAERRTLILQLSGGEQQKCVLPVPCQIY
jgi:ABC-type ATPase involved in cell division